MLNVKVIYLSAIRDSELWDTILYDFVAHHILELLNF